MSEHVSNIAAGEFVGLSHCVTANVDANVSFSTNYNVRCEFKPSLTLVSFIYHIYAFTELNVY